MALLLAEEVAVTGEHLSPEDVVAYVDRVTTPEAHKRMDGHLAVCIECRDEVSDAARIIASLPRRRMISRNAILAAAAVAAVLLVFLIPRAPQPTIEQHRGSATPAATQGTIISPTGAVDLVSRFVWSAVPLATRYDVTVFDSAGTVIWDAHTIDTVLVAPPDVRFRPSTSYFWRVEAQTDIDRKLASQLVQFSVVAPRPR